MEFNFLEAPLNTNIENIQVTSQLNDAQPYTVENSEIPAMNDMEPLKDVLDWNPEIRYDVPGVPIAAVSGDPYGIAPILDSHQGDTNLNAAGTCGLTSIANVCVMAGMDITEADVVKYALDNNVCDNDIWAQEGDRGGTTIEDRLEILKSYGIDATSYDATDVGGSFENIANEVEDGKGAILALNAGYLWDDPSCVTNPYGTISSNHCVTVTGVARDVNNGEVTGFYICDSGRGLDSDACRYLSVDELSKAYNGNIMNASVIFTDQSIRNN